MQYVNIYLSNDTFRWGGVVFDTEHEAEAMLRFKRTRHAELSAVTIPYNKELLNNIKNI